MPGKLALWSGPCLSLVFMAVLVGSAYPQEPTQEPQLPVRISYVSDYAQTLDEPTETDLNRLLAQVQQEMGVEIYVLTVLTTDPLPINEYSQRISETWNLGEEDPKRKTLLLLVAVNDGLYRLVTNQGIESIVTDQHLQEISEKILTPAFTGGQFAQGIVGGINRVLQILSQESTADSMESRRLRTEDFVGIALALVLVALVVAVIYLFS